LRANRTKGAVFLDRDGTIIHDVGYLGDPAGIRLYQDAVGALQTLQREYELFVVSNQSGVARGHITLEQVDQVNRRLGELLAEHGVHIAAWYMCPHRREDACDCMKPAARFLREAADAYGLDLSRSFVIGDHPHDPATADAVGAFGLYLLTGHGPKHIDSLPDDQLVFHSLGDAADWIMAHPEPRESLAREIGTAAETLRSGGLAAFPTETVYGLGANALDPAAVARIFEVKERPLDDPLIVHVAQQDHLAGLVPGIPGKAARLIEALWPGPLTLVLPKLPVVPDIVTAGLSTVAVRMPSNAIARKLIDTAGVPVAAPSANRFGRTSPTTAAHVTEQLGSGWGVVVDGGACRVGVESTVLSLVDDRAVLLRPGGAPLEEVERLIGKVELSMATGAAKPMSPGMLPRHYAPSTPLRIVPNLEPWLERADVGILAFAPLVGCAAGPVETLTQGGGNPTEAAVNLYAAMRRLDGRGLTLIVAQEVPNHGLGRAVNDRLRKASARTAETRSGS
jgi:L-threonylcarbamoyladenylate synthase